MSEHPGTSTQRLGPGSDTADRGDRLPGMFSGRLDQVVGELIVPLWLVIAFRASERAPVLTPTLGWLVIIALVGTMLVLRPRGSVGSIRISIPILLWMGLWIMSSLWAWDFFVWSIDARIQLVMLGTGMLVASTLDLPRLARALVHGVYFAGLLSVFVSLTGSGIDENGAWTGGFFHKNQLGAFFAVGLLVVSLLERRVLVRLAGATMCFGLILLAQSATALLMVAAGGATVLVIRRVASLPPREAAAYFFSMSAIVLFVLSALAVQAASVVSTLGRDISLSGRTELWPAVIESISQRPLLGYGPGLWVGQARDPARYISNQAGFSIGHAHNTILEVLITWGTVGLVLYLVLVSSVVRSGWRIVRLHPAIASVTLGFVAMMLVQSISEPALGGWISLLGLFHVLSQRIEAEHRRSLEPETPVWHKTTGLPPLPVARR